jgi:nitroreductase
MNEQILDVFRFRHACKKFDPAKKIPDDQFMTIIEAARLSPSSFGFEPWKFLVVQDMEKRQRLLTATWGAQGQYPSASHVIVCLVKKKPLMRYDSDYIWNIMTRVHNIPEEAAKMRRDKYETFLKSDFGLWESDALMEAWACRQVYIALGNMMTVAAWMGIDSCPIEGFDKQKMEVVLAEDFAIDTSLYGMGVGLALGYRIDPQKPKTRQAMEDVVSWY